MLRKEAMTVVKLRQDVVGQLFGGLGDTLQPPLKCFSHFDWPHYLLTRDRACLAWKAVVGFPAQVHILQEQLSVEVNARADADARVQRLLQQNTDLLQHISLLVKQIQELELKAASRLPSSESHHFLQRILHSSLCRLFPPPLNSAGKPLFSLHPWSFSLYSAFTSFMSLRFPHSLSPGTQLIIRWQPSLRSHCCFSRPVAVCSCCRCSCIWTRSRHLLCPIVFSLYLRVAVDFTLYLFLPEMNPSTLSKLI